MVGPATWLSYLVRLCWSVMFYNVGGATGAEIVPCCVCCHVGEATGAEIVPSFCHDRHGLSEPGRPIYALTGFL